MKMKGYLIQNGMLLDVGALLKKNNKDTKISILI
jgi:hypothetical protein